ncbi:hypothetical protein ACFFOP_38565 [Sinosporangium siamense]|uniref:hypothetical protein n=1 Tax=Sinosporangium siamense TaxID=1367973 RepID=UPI0035EA1F7B
MRAAVVTSSKYDRKTTATRRFRSAALLLPAGGQVAGPGVAPHLVEATAEVALLDPVRRPRVEVGE